MATFEEHLKREALLAKTPLWGNSYTIKSNVFRFVETREQKFEKGDETNPPRMSNVVTRFLVVEKPDSEKTQQFFVGDDFYDATNNTIHVYAPILKKTQKKARDCVALRRRRNFGAQLQKKK